MTLHGDGAEVVRRRTRHELEKSQCDGRTENTRILCLLCAYDIYCKSLFWKVVPPLVVPPEAALIFKSKAVLGLKFLLIRIRSLQVEDVVRCCKTLLGRFITCRHLTAVISLEVLIPSL